MMQTQRSIHELLKYVTSSITTVMVRLMKKEMEPIVHFVKIFSLMCQNKNVSRLKHYIQEVIGQMMPIGLLLDHYKTGMESPLHDPHQSKMYMD